MTVEVEAKFRVQDTDAVAARLKQLGASELPAIDLSDVYFGHPARDFASTREALRVRTRGDGADLTYKGTAQPGAAVKSREEIEVGLENSATGAVMERLLLRLGFRVVAALHKRRIPFVVEQGGKSFTVVLDDVQGIGRFVEVETLVKGTSEVPEAEKAVLAFAGLLGLKAREPRSYLEMALKE